MEEIQFKFGWKKRLKILFGKRISIFIDRKVVGTFVDKNGDCFIELREIPKKKTEDMVSLFG